MANWHWINGHHLDLDGLSQEEKLGLYYQLSIASGLAQGANNGFVDALHSRKQIYQGAAKDIQSATDDIKGYGEEGSFFSYVAQGLAGLQTVKGGADVVSVVAKHNPETRPFAEAWDTSTKLGDSLNAWWDEKPGKASLKVLEMIAPGLVSSDLKDSLKGSMKLHKAAYEVVTGETDKAIVDGISGVAKVGGQKLVEDGVDIYKGLDEAQKGVANFVEAGNDRERLLNTADHAANLSAGLGDSATGKAEHLNDIINLIKQGQDPSTAAALNSLKVQLPPELINKQSLDSSINTLREQALNQANKLSGDTSFDYAPSLSGGGTGTLSGAADDAEQHAETSATSDKQSQEQAQNSEQASQEAADSVQQSADSASQGQQSADASQQAELKAEQGQQQANADAAEAGDANSQADAHAQTADHQQTEAQQSAINSGENSQQAQQDETEAGQAASQADSHVNDADSANSQADSQNQTAQSHADQTVDAQSQSETLNGQISDVLQSCGTACDEAESHQNEAQSASGEAEQALSQADAALQEILNVFEQARTEVENMQQTYKAAEDLRQQILTVREETESLKDEARQLQEEADRFNQDAQQARKYAEAHAQSAEKEAARAEAAANRAEAVV